MTEAHAELSCTACRRLKRKCSKELPSCSLCERVRRRCDYPTPSQSPDGHINGAYPRSAARSPRIPGFNELASLASFGSSTEKSSPSQPLKHREIPRSSQSFPATWFLDSVGSSGMHMSIPSDLQWLDIASFLVTLEHARAVSERWFETTHNWLPTVSRTRLRRVLNAASDLCESADFAAMIVAMGLLSGSEVLLRAASESAGLDESYVPTGVWDGKVNSRSTKYQSLKAVLSACEQKGQLTTSFLAAQVVTAAYEIGQGIYPAAYFTVGACVRTCHTMGLHNRRFATQLSSKVDTWNETEERRRLWWSSIILDRFVSVGFLHRPLAVPSIPPNEIIPGDDNVWDSGDLSVNPVLIMSIESQTKVSPFARTCQAAHILGRVYDHVNEHADPADIDFHFQEALSIMRAGEALLEMVREELRSDLESNYRFFSAMALCCSALLSIYGVHSCIEVDPIESSGRNRGIRLEMQQKGIDGYRRIAGTIQEFAKEVAEAPIEKVSPFVLHCIYEAGCCFAWIFRENGSESQIVGLSDVRAALKRLEGKWAVAGEYLKLLHDTEHHYTGACSA